MAASRQRLKRRPPTPQSQSPQGGPREAHGDTTTTPGVVEEISLEVPPLCPAGELVCAESSQQEHFCGSERESTGVPCLKNCIIRLQCIEKSSVSQTEVMLATMEIGDIVYF